DEWGTAVARRMTGRCRRGAGAWLRASGGSGAGGTIPLLGCISCRKVEARDENGQMDSAGNVALFLPERGIRARPDVSFLRIGSPERAGTLPMTRPRRLRSDSVQSPLETYLREINETP